MGERRFTSDQADAFRALMSGRNVFLTGEAGTGKSFVLNAYLEECEMMDKKVLAMAPTGIAALNLRKGATIHRSLGIKPSFCDPDEELGKPRSVLMEADVIVVDEISMVRIDLFERMAKMIIAAKRASGTKQIIIVGDFFQLPPVVTNRDEEALLACWPGNIEGYCFKSAYWKGLMLEPYVLHEVVRQTDSAYISALNHARRGDPSCADFFNKHAIKKRSDAPEEALWLCTTNKAADGINEERLAKIPGRASSYVATVEGEIGRGDMPTAERLRLKVGARVMSVANDADGEYQNGSLGTVTSLSSESVRVRFDDTGASCEIKPKRWSILKPVVSEKKDDKGEKIRVIDHVELGAFVQVPLRLAWAVTIHKSQGQTFDNVVVETHAFATGQLYVGLSRCRTSAGLTLYPKLEAKYLHEQADVVSFYDSLEAGAGKYRLVGAGSDLEGDPLGLLEDLLPYMRRESATQADAIRHYVRVGLAAEAAGQFKELVS